MNYEYHNSSPSTAAWPIVYHQARRWLDAGCFEHLGQDLRALARATSGRATQPSAACTTLRLSV